MNRAERYYRRFRDSDDPDLVLEDAYAAGSVWSSTVFVGGKKYNSVVLTYLDGSKITICEQYNMRDQILSLEVSTPGHKPINILPRLQVAA